MLKSHLAALAALALLTVDARAAAPTSPPPPEKSAAEMQGHPQEVSLNDTRTIDFVSRVNGHAYSIQVALPDVPPPPGGYPVIYVFDGDGYFLSFVEAVRGNGNAEQAVVVGLGYPRNPAWVAHILGPKTEKTQEQSAAGAFGDAQSKARVFDLAPPVDEEKFKELNAFGSSFSRDEVGGVDAFLKTIETEVKPRVYALTNINKGDQALFGHSLGGLAVLEALFTEPGAFHTFIAASPSIHWSNREVLRSEAGFVAQVRAGKVAPHILITVGDQEQSPPKTLPPEYESRRAEITASIRKDRMIDNACELAERLKAVKGSAGYEVTGCVVFKDQDHGISVWPAIGRAVAFAFPH